MFEKEAEIYTSQNWDKDVIELKNDTTYQYVKGSPHFYDSAIKRAYIAGATENGIQWHDLEKNPNDLPSKGRLVICYLKEDVFDVGIFKKEIELQCGKERIRKWAYFELPKELK